MSKVSFEKNVVQTPVEGVTIETTTTACEPAPADAGCAEQGPESGGSVPTERAVSVPAESPHAIFDDNNIGFEDIIIPKINIVKKVGDLSLVFNACDIVLDQTHVLFSVPKALPNQPLPAAPAPLNVVVIGFKRTSFVEKVDGGGLGLHCRTREEVVKCGGTLDYKEWNESVKANKENPAVKALRRFDYMTTAMLLVEKPATFPDPNQTVFPYLADGKQYVMVMLTMKGSDYNSGAKTIFTFRKTRSFGNPNVSYSDNFFTLGSEMKKFPTGNTSPVPDFRPAGPVTDGLKALIASIKGC